MTKTPSFSKAISRLLAAGAAVALIVAPTAKASEYLCRVPRALLCDGCARQIAITLQSGGGCRISFTPADVSPSQLPVRATETFEFRVEMSPMAVPRLQRRWRTPRVALARPPPNSGCFVFNGQKYCE